MSSEQSVAHTKRLEESSEGKIYFHFNLVDGFDLYLDKEISRKLFLLHCFDQ